MQKEKRMMESVYILYRKIKAFSFSLCFYIFRLFRIKKNRVSVCTFEGKGGFGCNPKYIVMELHKRNPDLEFIWMTNDLSKEFPDYIKKVPDHNWSRAYWMSTSRVWIDNYRTRYGTKKRKGQFYINTWHGMIGFKSIGLWRGPAFSKMAYIVSKKDSKMVDYFLSDSKFTTSYFPKGLVYDGQFLEVGSPRCDILLNDLQDARRKVREAYHLPCDSKCVMFAPTFREASVSGRRSVSYKEAGIDFKRLIKNLKQRFGSEWCLFLRLHPQIKEINIDTGDISTVDVSKNDDMYEILAGMDVLVTDYSSCSMDAEMMHIPVFIYADDLQQYKSERGDFVWDIDKDSRGYNRLNKSMFPELDATLPFSIARNNDELEEDILSFDENVYLKRLDDFEKSVGLIREGNSSQKVADVIMKKCGDSTK